MKHGSKSTVMKTKEPTQGPALSLVDITYALLADAHAFHVPAAIVGVANLAVLEPATRRRWWRLNVTRTAITCERPADKTTQNTGRDAASDNTAIVMVTMSARWVAIWWWRRTATIIAIWAIIILRRCGLNAGQNRSTRDDTSKHCQKNFFHSGLLHVSRTFTG